MGAAFGVLAAVLIGLVLLGTLPSGSGYDYRNHYRGYREYRPPPPDNRPRRQHRNGCLTDRHHCYG